MGDEVKKDKDQSGQRQNDKKSVATQENHLISFPYLKDKNVFFILKKTERITEAFYLLTNFFADSEPMKWIFRSLSSRLLSFCIGFLHSLPGGSSAYEEGIQPTVSELISLLEVGKTSGLFSVESAEILTRELLALLSHLEERFRLASSSRKPEFSRSLIRDDFFRLSPQLEAASATLEREETASQFTDGSSRTFLKSPLERPAVPEASDRESQAKIAARGQALTNLGAITIKRNARRSAIVSLLKRKKEVTVKDVSELVKNCSEKTLQRELLSLVSEGIIKKRGERRWTRYSLS
ncbi:hypothetical protein EPN83_00865 [Patescibacteria group bacterium]|nr:MAG: hypothetical protein EPN83_00865 [Patescibacteria group bacterium]